MKGRKLKYADYSGLASKKVCGKCEAKKDIECFYVRKYTSPISGIVSFYATSNCKTCHKNNVNVSRNNKTPEEREMYNLYHKNYHSNRKQNKYI